MIDDIKSLEENRESQLITPSLRISGITLLREKARSLGLSEEGLDTLSDM
jgi:hypothetical protein